MLSYSRTDPISFPALSLWLLESHHQSDWCTGMQHLTWKLHNLVLNFNSWTSNNWVKEISHYNNMTILLTSVLCAIITLTFRHTDQESIFFRVQNSLLQYVTLQTWFSHHQFAATFHDFSPSQKKLFFSLTQLYLFNGSCSW